MINPMTAIRFLAALLTLFAVAFAPSSASAAGATYLPFGHATTTPSDPATLQKGAQLYFNYCAGCHGLQYKRYSRLAKDLNLTEEQVLTNFNFTGAGIGDYVKSSMPKESAAWFGVAPPDLSLTARSRGIDWIYNYLLSFYPDPTRPIGWNNTVFPNASMPHVLWHYEGIKQAQFNPVEAGGHCKTVEISGQCFEGFGETSGGLHSASEYQRDMAALTSFLEYVGEPALVDRERFGPWVLLYLSLFTLIAWLLKTEYWKDVH